MPARSLSAVKKDVQKLQRAIVDGLEDVKAQEIVVFDTEHLSPLFERVIIASGTSNRQTKALAASVVDAVRDAGFAKPRIEGEANGEWIIVDCGHAVAHVMQPAFRSYYNLEELWGDKPVRLKLGAVKPARADVSGSESAPATKSADKSANNLRRSSAAKKGLEENYPTRAQQKKAQERIAVAAKKVAASAAKNGVPSPSEAKTPAPRRTRVATVVVNAPTKPTAKRASTAASRKSVPGKKAPARKA